MNINRLSCNRRLSAEYTTRKACTKGLHFKPISSLNFYEHTHRIYGSFQFVVHKLSHQFHCTFLAGVIGTQLAAEGTGEDGFFDEVDLFQNPFGGFFGLLLLFKKVIKNADDFALFFLSRQTDFYITNNFGIKIRLCSPFIDCP